MFRKLWLPRAPIRVHDVFTWNYNAPKKTQTVRVKHFNIGVRFNMHDGIKRARAPSNYDTIRAVSLG